MAAHENDSSSHSSNTLTEVPTNHSQRPPRRPAHWKLVTSHSLVTKEVLDYGYNGSGTEDDPYVVEFIPDDPRDPMNFPESLKWTITILCAVATLAVTFVSSAYSGGVRQLIVAFDSSEEVILLGISLFVLGVSSRPVRRVLPAIWLLTH